MALTAASAAVTCIRSVLFGSSLYVLSIAELLRNQHARNVISKILSRNDSRFRRIRQIHGTSAHQVERAYWCTWLITADFVRFADHCAAHVNTMFRDRWILSIFNIKYASASLLLRSVVFRVLYFEVLTLLFAGRAFAITSVTFVLYHVLFRIGLCFVLLVYLSIHQSLYSTWDLACQSVSTF